jgi:hypothetical protein
MAKRAAKIDDLTVKQNDMHFARWRDVQVDLQDYEAPAGSSAQRYGFSSEQSVVDTLDRLEEGDRSAATRNSTA